MQLPQSISRLLSGYDTDGQNHATSSAATVLRFVSPPANELFLKIEQRRPKALAPGLQPEHAILRWLGGQLSAPRSLAYHQRGTTQYLLTQALPGSSAESDFPAEEYPRLVQLLAEGLHRIHAHPTANCPFDRRATSVMARALDRIGSPGLNEERRDELQRNLHELNACAVLEEDLVFTHGDYCLPNVMIDNGTLAGFIDWGYAGLGDRYRDFMAAEYSVERNLGAEWVTPFFEAYGVEPIEEKMRVYRLLYDLW
mgnify:CR=1 FL=1|jgi:aminoglycoside phosphotransferase